MRQPPMGGVPAIAMSPPRLTSTPPAPAAARAARRGAPPPGRAGACVQRAELAAAANPATGRVDVLETLAPRGSRGGELPGIGGETVHRGPQRLPAFARDGHHEPPLVTVPLPL